MKHLIIWSFPGYKPPTKREGDLLNGYHQGNLVSPNTQYGSIQKTNRHRGCSDPFHNNSLFHKCDGKRLYRIFNHQTPIL